MSKIEYVDVTGTTVFFTQEQITQLITSMPPEQRRFSRIMAETIQKPHEIWKEMREESEIKGQWRWVRFYVQYLDLSESDVDASFAAVVVGFSYRSRWELETMGLVLGNQESVMARINQEVRTGSCEYSSYQH